MHFLFRVMQVQYTVHDRRVHGVDSCVAAAAAQETGTDGYQQLLPTEAELHCVWSSGRAAALKGRCGH